MTRTQVQEIVDRMPAYERALRGKQMLDGFAGQGCSEVECPACRGSGQIGRNIWDGCPLCCRQGVVPGGVATWFRQQGLGDRGLGLGQKGKEYGVAAEPLSVSFEEVETRKAM